MTIPFVFYLIIFMLGLILKEFPVNKVQCSTLQIVVLRNGISAKFLFFSESVNVNFWNR